MKKIIKQCEDHHRILNNSFENLFINNRKPILIKSYFNNITSDFFIIRSFIVFLATIKIIIDINSCLKNKNNNIVLREFWNIPFIFLYPFFFFYRSRIFLNINHNFSKNKSIKLSMLILIYLRYKFIFFDGSAAIAKLPIKLSNNIFTPLFPCKPKYDFNKNSIAENLIGFVGDFRREKSLNNETVQVINSLLNNGLKVVIGYRYTRPTNLVSHKNLLLVSTLDHVSYHLFLKSISILIVIGDMDKYYFRHSGTIMDAISFGVIPVVPNYPVFTSQVSLPNIVGQTYNSLFEIKDIIYKINESKKIFHISRVSYLNTRSESFNLF